MSVKRPRAILCWELGAGTGHVYPYLSLLTHLQQQGWECAVAAKNTAEVNQAVTHAGVALFQAPLCLNQFGGLNEHAFNYTEIMLHFGYASVATLNGMFSAWCSLFRAWQPDLVIGSAAPTALLAASALTIPDMAVGSGFNCPPALNPLPLIRPWQQGIEARISNSESLAKRTINAVLKAHGFSERRFAADMHDDQYTLLCTFAELDHYAGRREQANYLGMLPTTANNHASTGKAESGMDIFAYLRADTHSEKLLSALAKRAERSLVYCLNISEAQRSKWSRPHLQIVASPVDINTLLPGVRMVISYAGHNLTAEALLAGKPLLLLPTHLEQSLNADNVQRMGAGLVIRPGESNPKFLQYIDRLLNTPDYTKAAMTFATKHQKYNPQHALDKAVSCCTQRIK